MPRPDALLHLFGTPHWRSAEGARHDLPDKLPGWLLAHLAYRADWTGRDALAGLFWPDRSDDEAQHNLRANLHRVRSLLAGWGLGDRLEAERRRVRVLLPTDVADFRGALGRGDWGAAAAPPDGPLLAALSFRGFPLLEAWAATERSAFAAAWADASAKAAAAREAAGDVDGAVGLLLALLAPGEGPEEALQSLLRLAAGTPRRDEALATYERFRRRLADDLGVAPAERTAALAEALRGRRPLPAAALVAPAQPAPGGVPRAVVQPPAIVGRAAELAVLAGAAPVVAVGGEPGVGKTRLLEEAHPGARWIACREGLDPVSFAPVVEHLRDTLDSLAPTADDRRELARLVPELAEGEWLPPADPATGAQRLLEALARTLEAGTAVLVVDDLQWADAATAELVLLIARRGRIRLRLAHREPVAGLQRLFDALADEGRLTRLSLGRLGEADLQALLALLSQGEAGPARFSAWLHRRTGGNPFFALQTLRALFESGRLQAGPQGWSSDLDRITVDYSELEVPARVADLVQRRLRGLGEAARRLLAAVAVAGEARDVERLGATVGLDAWPAAEALAEAEAAGLLHEGRFAHDLVRQAHLGALPAAQRAVLHAAVARAFDGRLPPARLAEHWWEAGAPDAALAATFAAVQAQRHAGLQAAALDLLAHAARRLGNGADAAQHARIDALRAQVERERGRLDEAAALAAAVLAEPALPADRAAALRVQAEIAMQRGRLDEAGRLLAEAEVSDPDSVELLGARSALAQLQGRVADLVPALERELARRRREPPGPALVRALTSLGAACDELGDAARGLGLHEEAWRLAGRLGARHAQVDVAINLLWAFAALKRDDEGVAIAREALALGEYDASATLRNNLAWSLCELGRDDEARELYEQLAAGPDPTLALVARSKLVALHARRGDAARRDAVLSAVRATMTSTEVGLARASAAISVLEHGSTADVDAVLPALGAAALDPWLAERLRAALAARGIDPAPYVAGTAAEAR
jgi:DNA-binding SARP family transcriptional activator/tetratricopeptide (TPR) repeat protein